MEQLIKQAFENIETFEYIKFGYYDLMYLDQRLSNIEERYLSDSCIILPETWEHLIQPNALIKMALWATPGDHNSSSKFRNIEANISLSEALTPPPMGVNPPAPETGHSGEAEPGLSPPSSKASKKAPTAPSSLLPVVLIDAVGRCLSFPISKVRTWKVRAVSMVSIIF